MCGITGYINLDNRPVKDTSTILNMMRIQSHRGPDDSGIMAFNFTEGSSEKLPTSESIEIDQSYNSIIGFNRLSILDLSANGHQPMVSPDQKVIVAMNGEIYNAFDFKDELIASGYQFKSTTDTEVLLALYLKYGFEDIITKLNGMFAVVIIDLRTGNLYMARDRFGIKPLYYLLNDKTLAFSSELKSFRFIKNFRFELNEEKIDEYLLFRYNVNNTLFKHINTLTPGHYLTYQPNHRPKTHIYYDINQHQRTTSEQTSLEELSIKLDHLLALSVKSQLMSDVKLGCQLSGGVDSSLVTWHANKSADNNKFESFSITFDDPAYSEESYIDLVTNQLGIVSYKFLLNAIYFRHNIEHASWHLEEPLNHRNSLGIYLLAENARNYVTVLLSGEGADEVFGGYRRFLDILFPFNKRNVNWKIRNFWNHPPILHTYLKHNGAIMGSSFMNPILAARLYAGFNLKRALHDRETLFNSLSGSAFTRQIKYEMKSYLPALLIRQDKMTMAHSIENRVPFLDNQLVEASFNLHENTLVERRCKEGKNIEKYILKKVAGSFFGNDFAFRKKMGFGIPIKEFFADKEFSDYLNETILPGIKSRGIMNDKMIQRWLNKTPETSSPETHGLWIAIAFEIWARTYLDLKNDKWIKTG